MGRKITFQPLLPEIEVEELDLEGLGRLAWLLREERGSFRGLSIAPTQPTKFRGQQIVAISRDPRYSDEIIAEVGHLLVESQNGTRTITSNREVIRGSFRSIPADLLVPCDGEQILEPLFPGHDHC